MKKLLVSCFAIALLSACSSGGIEQISGMTPHIDRNDSAAVTVSSAVPGQGNRISALRKAIKKELNNKAVFREIKNRAKQSDIVVSARLTQVDKLSTSDKLMMGVLSAGKNKMTVDVTFKRRRTGAIIGRIIATGKSADQVANQIAEYLKKNQKS